MLKLKDSGVKVEGLQPVMYFALGLADQAFKLEMLDCVVTAALDGIHNPGSLHPEGLAVDIRNSNCNPEQFSRILERLKRLTLYGFQIVSENIGDTPATTATHWHIESDVKTKIPFWHLLTE